MSHKQQAIVLTPSPKAFFRDYIFGFLLSPFLIGFYLIWKAEVKRRNISYLITDEMLTISSRKYSRNIDLVNIIDVNVKQDSLGTGTVIVSTPLMNHPMIGLEEAEKVAERIRKDSSYMTNLDSN